MGTIKYKIIENFLDYNSFLELKNYAFSSEISWFWKKNQTKEDAGILNHKIYQNYLPNSDIYVKFIHDIILKLKATALIDARINLLVNNNKQESSNWHTDNGTFNSKTAILYLNTCNGFTILKLEKEEFKVMCEENKMLIFDSNVLHRAVRQTDTERRIVLNINYYDN